MDSRSELELLDLTGAGDKAHVAPQAERLRHTYKIVVTPDANGTVCVSLAPIYAGPLTIEVIVSPPNRCVFRQTIDTPGTSRFTLAPAFTGPLTIEVTVDPPKKPLSRELLETQQTIDTQEIFPGFPQDLVTSEAETESSQEDTGVGAASGIGKRKQTSTAGSAAKTSAPKRSKP